MARVERELSHELEKLGSAGHEEELPADTVEADQDEVAREFAKGMEMIEMIAPADVSSGGAGPQPESPQCEDLPQEDPNGDHVPAGDVVAESQQCEDLPQDASKGPDGDNPLKRKIHNESDTHAEVPTKVLKTATSEAELASFSKAEAIAAVPADIPTVEKVEVAAKPAATKPKPPLTKPSPKATPKAKAKAKTKATAMASSTSAAVKAAAKKAAQKAVDSLQAPVKKSRGRKKAGSPVPEDRSITAAMAKASKASK